MRCCSPGGVLLRPTFDPLLINGDFVSHLESGQDSERETVRNAGESDYNRARGTKCRARAVPARGLPAAPGCSPLDWAVGQVPCLLLSAPRTQAWVPSHVVPVVGMRAVGPHGPQWAEAAPGHMCCLEFTKARLLQRQKETQGCKFKGSTRSQLGCLW